MRRLLVLWLIASAFLPAIIILPAGSAIAEASSPTLSPSRGPVGTTVSAAAGDWIGCSSMSVSGWGRTLASGTINSSGAFSISFAVPSGAPLGDQLLQFSPTCSHSTWMPFVTFSVTAPAVDTTAPSVSWASPVGNGGAFTVSTGSVTLSALATDNAGVVRVKFTRWDAVASKLVEIATISAAPWRTTIAVSTLNGGYNQLNVQAWDAAGNASSSPYIWVYRTDNSPPSVSWISPVADGGTVTASAGSVTLGVSVTDNLSVVRVKYTRWDALALKWVDIATVSAAPWRAAVPVTTLNADWNQVNVQAWDSAGNASTSPYIWVRVPLSSFDRFFAASNGQFRDYDGAYGAQCVDLVQFWSQAIGGPRFTGDAKDLYKQTLNFYTWVDKTTSAVPQKGDIVVWSGAYNGGAGHVGIATGTGDTRTFEAFEQNDPTNSNSHLKTYSYASVLGWLRPPATVL